MPGIRVINSKLKSTYYTEPLKIEGLPKKRKESLEDFLIKFFNKWNTEKHTMYSSKNEVQTLPNKRRSMGDIYSICKYYYPECTIKEIAEIVYNKLFEKVPNFRSSFCYTIKKRVFYKGQEYQASQIFDENEKDEFGLLVKEWKNL